MPIRREGFLRGLLWGAACGLLNVLILPGFYVMTEVDGWFMGLPVLQWAPLWAWLALVFTAPALAGWRGGWWPAIAAMVPVQLCIVGATALAWGFVGRASAVAAQNPQVFCEGCGIIVLAMSAVALVYPVGALTAWIVGRVAGWLTGLVRSVHWGPGWSSGQD